MLTWVIKTYLGFVAPNQNISVVNDNILQVRFTFIRTVAKLAASNNIFRVNNDVAVWRKS